MNISVFLARQRRVLLIGLLSLLLHLLALALVDGRFIVPTPIAASAPLTLRLAMTPAPIAAEAPASAPPSSAHTPSPKPAPAPSPSLPPAAPLADEPAPPAPSQLTAAPTPPAAQTVPPEFRQRRNDEDGGERPQAMPPRYRVDSLPATRIDYTVHISQAGAPAQDGGAARLDWRTDNQRYRLELDGVLGNLVSEGGMDDAGIAPERADELQGAVAARTVFDRAGAPLPQGAQDSASVLLQLAGMGRADPMQMQDVLEFWIGSADGGRVERYQVLGEETVATGIGALATLHLTRMGRVGEARVDVWLAPQQSWMPVQIRVTEPGGAARTQTLATIEIGGAPGS